jgi:hypothetical protein
MNTAPTSSPSAPGADLAQNEALILQALRLLPAESLLRVLHSLPPALLRAALDVHGGHQTHAPSPHPLTTPAPPLPQVTSTNPADKRGSARHRTLRGAKIIFNNRVSVVDAQVRDISDGGCRIRVAAPAHLPATFLLQITGMPGEKRCEARWRTNSEIGVKFIA